MRLSNQLKLVTLLIGFLWVSKPAEAQGVAIKTNLIEDATTTMNLALEFGIKKRSSLELSGSYNPWVFRDNKQFRLAMIQPEYRFWFCENFAGSFVGAHAHGGLFNIGRVNLPYRVANKVGLKPADRLYTHRHEGEFIGGGVSYGYHWLLGKHWNLEASLGAGYAYIKSDKWEPHKCGKRLERDVVHHYWGITKATFSIVYLF